MVLLLFLWCCCCFYGAAVVMKELKSLDQDLQMKNTLSVDIRYADDTTLISTVFNKLKISSGELEEACRKWGMKINGGKCKIISTSTDSIKIDGKNVDHVEEFVFLGSVVPDTSADVMRRIALAASAFGRLQKVIWDRRDISNHLKIRLFNALLLPIATYASETWTLKSEDTRKLTVFEMRCLRSILGTTLADRIRNTDIITRSGIRHTIIDHIKTRRLSWFGHVVRRPEDSYVYKAYKDDFTQARSRGRPPKRWSAQIREDTGLPLLTLERRALNRGRWRGDVRLVNARGVRKAYAAKSVSQAVVSMVLFQRCCCCFYDAAVVSTVLLLFLRCCCCFYGAAVISTVLLLFLRCCCCFYGAVVVSSMLLLFLRCCCCFYGAVVVSMVLLLFLRCYCCFYGATVVSTVLFLYP